MNVKYSKIKVIAPQLAIGYDYTSIMSLKRLMSALAEDLPIVFVYIGWANYYDGTERVVGGHRRFQTHPDEEVSESSAFTDVKRELFCCGIGRGSAPRRLHVVFIAFDEVRQVKRVVGLYAAAEVELGAMHDKNGKDLVWAEVRTEDAVCISIDRRPQVTAWKKGQGQRRWASRPSGTEYPRLRKMFQKLKRDLPRLIGEIPQDNGEDQTYSGLEAREGQPRQALVTHRRREAKLRKAKLAKARSANQDRLVCEVPGCGFDFFARYGNIGFGYAHVHHRAQLSRAGKTGRKTTLNDLAIVCANCHSMIHKGGECRDMETLIPRKPQKIKKL